MFFINNIDEIYNIEESICDLIKKWHDISKIGWIKRNSTNCGEAGNNLETLLGKENNDFQVPDFDGIEIKTKKDISFYHYFSLFNCSPYGDDFFEIKRIREKYGYPDKELKECKVFNGEVCCNVKKKIGLNFYFELKIDREKKRIIMLIYDLKGNIIDNSTFWPFEVLEERIYCKLQYLAFIKVKEKINNNQKYYKYCNLKIFKFKGFEYFLSAIEQNYIKINFKIGVFKSGKRIGQIHDRGTCFRINENFIDTIYDEIYSPES